MPISIEVEQIDLGRADRGVTQILVVILEVPGPIVEVDLAGSEELVTIYEGI